jgi:hypothetical protein
MHLSISSFRTRQPGKAHIALVLALCALFCLSVELIVARYFGRVSRIEKRRETEYRAAVSMRSARAYNKTSVLVAGNSLLLDGVDFPELERNLSPDVEPQRTVFENTSYLNWHYGLRRLFNAGARPDVVALVLSPWQLISDATEGDYCVEMLVDPRDLVRFAGETGADRNRLSVMALDKASFFFGSRAEIRTWILGKMLPDLPALTQYFRFPVSLPADSSIAGIARKRLDRLRELCEQYGVRFVLVVPPAREDSGLKALVDAAAIQGVTVLIPIPVLPASDYADLIHLNPQGAGKFTPALAQSLKQILNNPTTQTPMGSSAHSVAQIGASLRR